MPAPDYPLWTAAVSLSGGTPVHYLCDEQSDWLPDIDDIARKITPQTRAIVVINPNNPTGAVYPRAVLESIARLAERRTETLVVGNSVSIARAEGLADAGVARAVYEIREKGIIVLSLNMPGTVPAAADLVVSDPVQCGVMAVMAVSDSATFDIARQRGRRY